MPHHSLPFPFNEVWAAITEPARIADWWPPSAAGIAVYLREGGSIAFERSATDSPPSNV